MLDSDNISAFSSVNRENLLIQSTYYMFLNLDFSKTGLSGNITTCETMYVMSLIHYKHSLNVNLLLSFLLSKNKKIKIQKSGIKKMCHQTQKDSDSERL